MPWETRKHQENIRSWLVPSVLELKYNTAIREIIKLGKGKLGWVILPPHFVVCKIHRYTLYYFLFIAFSSDSQRMRAISCLKPFLPTVWAPSCLTWGKCDIQPCIARVESSKLQLQKAVGLFHLNSSMWEKWDKQWMWYHLGVASLLSFYGLNGLRGNDSRDKTDFAISVQWKQLPAELLEIGQHWEVSVNVGYSPSMALYHHFRSSVSTENRHNHHPSDSVGFCASVLCVLQLTPKDVLWPCQWHCVVFIQRQLHKTVLSDTELVWTAHAGVFPWNSTFKLQHSLFFVIDTSRIIASSAILTTYPGWANTLKIYASNTVSPCNFHFNQMDQNSQYLKKYCHAPHYDRIMHFSTQTGSDLSPQIWFTLTCVVFVTA